MLAPIAPAGFLGVKISLTTWLETDLYRFEHSHKTREEDCHVGHGHHRYDNRYALARCYPARSGNVARQCRRQVEAVSKYCALGSKVIAFVIRAVETPGSDGDVTPKKYAAA